MKSLICYAIIIYGSVIGNVCFSGNYKETPVTEFSAFQQQPFYFIGSVPSEIPLNGSVDLGFFANRLIVSQYRFRLEIPAGKQTVIDKNLINWSLWRTEKMVELKVPWLDLEGEYKLLIEYKTPNGTDVQLFSRHFDVIGKTFSSSSSRNSTVSARQPAALTSNTSSEKAKTTTVSISKGNTNSDGQSGNKYAGTPASKIKRVKLQGISVPVSAIMIWKPALSGLVKKGDQNIPLYQASVAKGSHITNNPNLPMVTPDPGKMSTKEPVNNKMIHGADSDGNYPLHRAVLTGDISFVQHFENQDRSLNIKNQYGLSPLQLAVYLNDEKMVKALLDKGSNIELKGNEGYTSLHIASELNYIEIARDLLLRGAKTHVKTRQKLTPVAIAGIQNNSEMARLIRSKGKSDLGPGKSLPVQIFMKTDSYKMIHEINLALPYDQNLVRKRRFNKFLEAFSVPLFVISTTGAIYLHSEANHSYSLYKNAETLNQARHYYDKTLMLDKYSIIPVAVSFTSVYCFIHSIIKRKNITEDMRKMFY